ncbi:MAG: aldose 1-epimerase family protein [Clostridia bacterium]|nr:aldose 1-epimerase family protein [Clostridia bacterium]
MSRNVTIENDKFIIDISTLGAEIQSFRDKSGNEYLWQGDPAVWSGRAPVLFPICGALAKGKFTLDKHVYKLEKHGFALKSSFELEAQSTNSASFLLTDSENTLQSYPFSFELRVIFTLENSTLKVEYRVCNRGEKTMYFSCGAHEAYALPCGIDGTQIAFEKNEELKSYLTNGSLLSDEYEKIETDKNILTLTASHFDEKSLIFKDIRSKSVTLTRSGDGKRVRVDFDGFDHLLLWQVAGAKYICIEPWTGLPDPVDSTGDITKKPSITKLEPGKEKSFFHQITILD